MPKRTNQFQQLIHAIHLQLSKDVKVTESKFLRNRVTGEEREVDIVIEAETSLYPIVIGIECSKSKRPATIEWVERMIEKHRDLTDNKLVLVSGSGFTPTALKKAELEGVEALTLGESKTVDWTEVVGKIAQMYILRYLKSGQQIWAYSQAWKLPLSISTRSYLHMKAY